MKQKNQTQKEINGFIINKDVYFKGSILEVNEIFINPNKEESLKISKSEVEKNEIIAKLNGIVSDLMNKKVISVKNVNRIILLKKGNETSLVKLYYKNSENPVFKDAIIINSIVKTNDLLPKSAKVGSQHLEELLKLVK
jgi:hypothetical protein